MRIITWLNFTIAFIGIVTIYQHENRYNQDLRNQAGVNHLLLDYAHGRAIPKETEHLSKK